MSRKRDLSTSSERGTTNSENRSSSPIKSKLDKSNSDPSCSSHNGSEKKRHDSVNNNNHHHHHKSSKRRLSENNAEYHTTNGHHSNSISPKLQKPKVIQSPTQSNIEHEASSSSESIPQKITTNNSTSKPIREAKKRSLIYTGNTRLFLETAIAAGLIDANGDEEDEDNEYVPPGGKITTRPQQSSSSSENEDESIKSSSSSSSDDDEDENKSDDNEEVNNSGDEMVLNEEPSESGINWNVRSRPQRHTHLIRFDNISKQDGI
jgi:hypothetical protein